MSDRPTFTARAPGKVILFGEHAINRGQPAIAATVGLYAECRIALDEGGVYTFRSDAKHSRVDRDAIQALGWRIDQYLSDQHYTAIHELSATDYFAAPMYVLAAMFDAGLPDGLDIEWRSDIPGSSGLGSGGAAFTAMVAALTPLLPAAPSLEQRAVWAHRGDIVAHGGVASALDTQTSLLGGVIRYTGAGLAEPMPCAPGLRLVIGNTGIIAATSEVNSRVRAWLAERPTSRMRAFAAIGALARAALPLLEQGAWDELGALFNLNQLALQQIGVSCPALETLIEAALEAGAFGAKLSGSGGGGIMIALTALEMEAAVAGAINAAGGMALVPSVGVPGVTLVAS